LANQVALIGMPEGWGEAFVRGSYRRWFQEGQANGSEPNLSESLREAGQDPAAIIVRARSPAAERRLQAETEIAQGLGLFGSPIFVVGRELFWGDDRLEDAIAWKRRGTLKPPSL
jgi:2-hydroxychromene-2-carboxylate isomerase